MNKNVTQQALLDNFTYNPLTGVITNRIDRSSRARAGQAHTSLNGAGYILIKFMGHNIIGNHLGWMMMTGAWPKKLDHINGIKTDNRWLNLRPITITRSQITANRSVFRNNRLGVKVVTKVGERYKAHIRIAGKLKYIGYYDTVEEASAVFQKVANDLYGELCSP